MAGRFSDTFANMLLDMSFSKASNSFPATFYVALSTSTPANDGTGVTEPVGNDYARVAVTNNATNWPAATSRSKSNGVTIAFPTATGAWGSCTHFALYDASTGGNFVAWGELTSPVSPTAGTQASFAVGALVINAPGN
jgi:hypothetical protein